MGLRVTEDLNGGDDQKEESSVALSGVLGSREGENTFSQTTLMEENDP